MTKQKYFRCRDHPIKRKEWHKSGVLVNNESGYLICRVLIKLLEQDLKSQPDIKVWTISQHELQMKKK